jgi:hypothetical protein
LISLNCLTGLSFPAKQFANISSAHSSTGRRIEYLQLAFPLHKSEAMSRIVKEPFSPPRRVTTNRASSFGWVQAFLAVVNLMFFKGQSS